MMSFDDPKQKIIFDLKLPGASKCVSMTILHDILLCMAWDIPDVGIEVYIINVDTGKWQKAEYK